jgi:hypothetical protein
VLPVETMGFVLSGTSLEVLLSPSNGKSKRLKNELFCSTGKHEIFRDQLKNRAIARQVRIRKKSVNEDDGVQ